MTTLVVAAVASLIILVMHVRNRRTMRLLRESRSELKAFMDQGKWRTWH